MDANLPRSRVVDDDGRGLAGLMVRRFDAAGEPLDEARTDVDGAFPLPEGGHASPLDRLGMRPLRVLEVAGPFIRVSRAEAEGWAAREGSPMVPGNRVDLLMDAEQFTAVEAAMDAARHSIGLSQLLFEENFTARPGQDGKPLLARVQRAAERGVHVRILINENAVVPDSYDELAQAFADQERIEVRRLPMSPNVAHSKLLLIDGVEAYLVGPPFEQKYWDTSRHHATDPRRAGALSFHDYGLRMRGPIVHEAERIFAALWSASGAGAPLEPVPPPPPAGDATIQLVRTLPVDLADGPRSRGILEAYLRAIANARRFIYIETQYFTSPTILEALRRAIDVTPELELILVLNTKMDIPTYDTWQLRRLADLGAADHPRIGAFTLRTGTRTAKGETGRIYTHSKLTIVDDVWATLGSANLDSASVEEVTEFGVPFEPNIETNAVLYDGVEGTPHVGRVAAWRRRAWAEHLGDEGVWSAAAPEESPLRRFRDAAALNARAMAAGEDLPRGHVIPFPLEGPPEAVPAQETAS